jgi:hypothetical protein
MRTGVAAAMSLLSLDGAHPTLDHAAKLRGELRPDAKKTDCQLATRRTAPRRKTHSGVSTLTRRTYKVFRKDLAGIGANTHRASGGAPPGENNGGRLRRRRPE